MAGYATLKHVLKTPPQSPPFSASMSVARVRCRRKFTAGGRGFFRKLGQGSWNRHPIDARYRWLSSHLPTARPASSTHLSCIAKATPEYIPHRRSSSELPFVAIASVPPHHRL